MELAAASRRRLDSLAAALATGFYISYIPAKLPGPRRPGKWTGAGFIGTLASLGLLPLIPEEPAALAVLLAVCAALAVWVCGRAEKILGRHDDPRIVLDEIVAFWAAVALLPRTPGVLAAGFVLFRAFDALKPPPCGRLERLPGGWGVVGDDLGAALWTNLIIRAMTHWWPSLLG